MFDFYRLEFDTDSATFFPSETKDTWIIFLSGNPAMPQLDNKLVCNSLVSGEVIHGITKSDLNIWLLIIQ